MDKNKIKRIVKKRVVLLDGAMGTELQRRGLSPGICPEVWCIENEKVLSDIHTAYKNSGSEIIYTFTFGGNRIKLGQYGIADVLSVNRKLARIARKSAGKDILVAGDIGPTGQFIQPFGPLDFEEAVSIFKEQIRGLIEGGVDILVIETIFDIQEARAALIAAKEISDRFVMVTMTFEENGLTLGGTDPVSSLITLQSLGADAVGCNCSLGPQGIIDFIKKMKPYAMVPLVAKPNAGLPSVSRGRTVFSMDDVEFASFARELVSSGVNMLGGCCGTTPAHIR
ncbi:MAG: 5-methyltetrahydrofolate--homocysteine methyltransferase, partial [Candidatus Omnitrophica bacterium]|nr:5-methyltetrahydrofolate--homocysteine methyltransferase [Candidatus Omnitrophota bacterium]MBD3269539.1 5-methyltetrahydrofolate--homocysteine methyltransferase [Candidatus Omnitrophota bacterium]